MKIIAAAEFRKNISRVLDAVTHRDQLIGIGRRNKVEAVILKWPARYNEGLDEITNLNANSSSFAFLEKEPDLYTIEDLKKKYV